jgi:asparagine synthetase B (glutamine-hydrolysing)
LSQHEFLQDLPTILEAMDQPSIDGVNAWFVSNAAKEVGLKVAISGLGGDELLAGTRPLQTSRAGGLASGHLPMFLDSGGWRAES